MTQVAIRRARPKDAFRLSALGRATFHEAFGAHYAREDLKAFLDQAYALERIDAILADGAFAAWLAEADGEPVGHALAGPCRLPHPEVTASCGELKRLYVLSPWRGGLGSRLAQTALAWLERDGPQRIWIGVWSQNDAAQRFYHRLGFEKVGQYHFEVGAARDDEFIMRRG
jgi:ribosomal protein S18 acetylase RimI-like enzyme